MAANDPSAMMAKMAARILGNMPPPPPSTSAQNAAAAPRTIRPSTAPAVPAAQTSKAPAPNNVVHPSTPSFASFSLPAAEPSLPVVKEQVVQPNLGPSLFGTPEQIAEARRFSKGATTGGKKSATGGKKSRPLSSADAVPSRPSSAVPTGPRSSVRRPSYTHGGAPASPATSTSRSTPPPSGSVARPAPSFTASSSSLAISGVLAPISKPQVKPDITFGKPYTFDKPVTLGEPINFGSVAQSSSAAASSFTDIASPKVEKAAEPKPNAPAISKSNTPAATGLMAAPPLNFGQGWQSFAGDEGPGAGTDNSFTAKNNEIKKEVVIPTIKVHPAEPTASARRIKQESKKSDLVVVPKTSTVPIKTSEAAPAATSVSEQSVTLSSADFARMVAQFAALSQRVGSLESENFRMLDTLEALWQNDERRRYLGTNGAKAPFELSVKCAPGTYCKVQANAALTVADLIRRVRVASNTSLAGSPAPRLAAEGQELGHALTLHEAGVTSNSSLEFMHDGVVADEDEEL